MQTITFSENQNWKDLAKEIHAVTKCAKVIEQTIGVENDLYRYLFIRIVNLTKILKSTPIDSVNDSRRNVGNYEKV